MDAISSNTLVLKSVNQLFGYRFFIPAYQRGYRWNHIQVEQLLKDIWEFAKHPPQYEKGQEKPFYCLQPIVVKKRASYEWEVIDGQQRLTTIFLILKTLENIIDSDKKNFEEIYYETRSSSHEIIGSEEFLRNVEKYEHLKDENVDFHHIYNAYKTVKAWFANKANTSQDSAARALLAPVLLSDTKVIWYEVSEDHNNNSVDIFTRLNIGKIPLTNAELIKALFLQKGNFPDDKVNLKQIQISSEWDSIEKALQNDAFWFFLYNPQNPIKYDNRIEYIFDLIMDRKKESEYYHTFNLFYKEFLSLSEDNKSDIDKIWYGIKKYFLTFDEWFNDYELFHYVGFLIDCGIQVNTIKRNSIEKSKDQFKLYLKGEIRKQVSCDIEEVQYGDNKNIIRKVLLLFNISIVLETQKSDMRFPFHKYKSENWDIEHVCSQTDKTIIGNKRYNWIDDILNYFVGSNDIHVVENYINTEENIEKTRICKLLLQLKKSIKIDDEKFESVYKLVEEYFKEDGQVEEKDDISNLALLDSATNRSYGNSFFPIKRKRIIENDMKGIFVPIATRNLFLKYYSSTPGEVMYWYKEDANDYLNAIKTTLKDYLKS